MNPTEAMSRRRFGACALALLLAGCAAVAPPPLKLTVLHTNDHHGRFWPDADGEYGMAARKTLVDRVRAEVEADGGALLLLDAGDVDTGVPESDLQGAEPDFRAMNAIGYDAMTVGNHEFDQPRAVLDKQRSWASFPLLAANIYREDGTRLFEPYRIFERGGRRIAVLGLTTDDTPKMVAPEHLKGVTVRAPIAEAAALVPELRARAEMVIALTHMGHYPDGAHGVNAPGDVEMARAVAGIDLIVGGHSHSAVCMTAPNRREAEHVPGAPCTPDRQNGTWIVQAQNWGRYLGRADFRIDAGQVRLVHYALLPVNLMRRLPDGSRVPYTEVIAQDPALHALLAPYQAAGQQRLGAEVARSDGVLVGEGVRSRPTNLGVAVTRSMIAKTGADLALMNSGGIRDSLPAGRITYRDLLKVQPFGNTLVVVEMSGAELLDYLRAAARMTPDSGGFAQIAGATLVIEGDRLVDARVGGAPVDPARRYRIALNSFTAGGGDGYPRLTDRPGYIDTGFVDVEALREFLAAHSPLKVADFEPGNAVIRR
jgi:5'-nucleotidase/UDP-sugar diphosphatase